MHRTALPDKVDAMDLIKIAKVQSVQLEKGQATYIGNLHLMPHHLIFDHPDLEIWISYHTVHSVEKGLPTLLGAWPLHIRCYNFVFVTLHFQNERDVTDVYESIQKLTCVSSVEQLYAFFYTPAPPFSTTDGWNIYDPLVEYERMGVGSKNDQWRFSDLNQSFSDCPYLRRITVSHRSVPQFSPTYPQILVVPSKISDTVLTYAAKHRSKARIPSLSYLHWNNMKASITRSSQPMVGLKQNRSIQDEKLIEAIFLTNVPQSSPGHQVYGSTATNLIIDARPTANAVANTAVGAGTENMENYRNCKKVYSGIDNIHVMRDSLNKLVEALQELDTKGTVSKATLQKSGWLKHIGAIMDGALMIVKNIHICNSHVLVHCSDGWDRTAQLTSAAQLCLDPFYRTLRGFQILIEKEWCSFGYKFMDRCGHLSNDKNFVALSATNAAANTFANVQSKFYNNKHIRETSPVFQQFLDCVFQIMHQNPTRFEFNEYFLTQLHYHVYSCQFGNFLFNCERERRHYMASTKCSSIWDFINSDKDLYLNKNFQPSADQVRGGDGGVLFPDAKSVKFWSKLFGRTDEELNAPDDISVSGSALSERMTPEMLGLGANYAESTASSLTDPDSMLDQRADDPLGIGSSPTMPRPRASSKTNNAIHTRAVGGFSTPGSGAEAGGGGGGGGGGGDDGWQRGPDNLTSKLPAALSGAFGGGLVDSFNRLTMNVRDTWYASTTGPGGSLSNSFTEEGGASQFREMQQHQPQQPQQPQQQQQQQQRAATLGRSSSQRSRPTSERELRSVAVVDSSLYTKSASSSPKHSLADLTLEHEINNRSYPYPGHDPLRRSSGSSSVGSVSALGGEGAAHKASSNGLTALSSRPPLKITGTSVPLAAESGAQESENPAPEPVKEVVKELPHPLFVE
ncbi:hypothetical protein BGZ98_005167 [Dissophora globulifera]|nr:hypothetical protein BGZ98_005167 [Dissophora globulifera]